MWTLRHGGSQPGDPLGLRGPLLLSNIDNTPDQCHRQSDCVVEGSDRVFIKFSLLPQSLCCLSYKLPENLSQE